MNVVEMFLVLQNWIKNLFYFHKGKYLKELKNLRQGNTTENRLEIPQKIKHNTILIQQFQFWVYI